MRKQIYTKNDKQVIEQEFDSLAEYCEYLSYGTFNPKITSKTSTDSTRNEWSGTTTYEEAINLCLYGDYSNKFNELIELKDELDDKINEKRRTAQSVESLQGYIPHVPNYLKGFPLQMINTIYTENKNTKYVTIYFNISQLQTYTKEQFYYKGVICLSLIDHLEKLDYQVSLKLFAGSYCQNQVILTFFNLKTETERLNLRNLFFPMTNVAFLRRLHFRLREITPELEAHWSGIYGYSLKSSEIRSYLDLTNTSIIFSYPDELGIAGKNLLAEAKKAYEVLGFNNLL
ncbi:MAG: hypothetical protein LBV55_01160 [Acholeplasmatales bacterium]|jgi:hypothetical protein|nr:hypothetical protein [Acholeplasmatales bacterium]